MIQERKKAFDNISRILAISRYDIEQHQLIADLSLNIHGENWFRDIFRFVYGESLNNANYGQRSFPAVDLVDKTNKIAYQITTTRTKEKVEDTLNKLKKTDYKDFKVKIFFLLKKAKFKKETVDYFKEIYSIDVDDYLYDYTDLLKDIDQLETNQIIELNRRFFSTTSEKYTDVIVLDLIFKHLLLERRVVKKNFDDDFGTVDTEEKLKVNKINPRISADINKGLDYRMVIDSLGQEDSLVTDLKNFVIDDLYKSILLEVLESKVSKKELQDKKTYELQDIASEQSVDFNKLIGKLHEKLESNIEIKDFNSMEVSWVIIAYFFELCDVGVDKNVNAK